MGSIFFGTWQRPQLVPAPERGMTRTHAGYGEEEEGLGNGGAVGISSFDSHVGYDWNFSSRKTSDAVNLDIFMDYKKGVYGKGFLYVADPNEYRTNLFRPQIAQPGLMELNQADVGLAGDYTSIRSKSAIVFLDTTGTIPSRPLRKAQIVYGANANDVPTGKLDQWTILVPPDMTLKVSATGAVIAGTPVVRAQTILKGGALGPTVDLTLGSELALPVLTNSFSGATYQAVRFYLTATTTATHSIELTSLIAQLIPSALPTPLLTRYISGRGVSGMIFRNSPMPETYSKMGLKALSFGLMEVEPWQRLA